MNTSKPKTTKRRRPVRSALIVVGAVALAISLAQGFLLDPSLPTGPFIGDLPEGLPHANEGAFEGGTTGTKDDVFVNNVRQEEDILSSGSFDIPTGGPPSPLFGARDWEQAMLRFEEFGPEPVPGSYHPGAPFPAPVDAYSVPDPEALEAFLRQEMYPEPYRMSNDIDWNPWKPEIEHYLGRTLTNPPAEGRPPGEGWAHQRWDEFPPQEIFVTAQAGARMNLGLRDDRQLHGYAVGEFAPGGLYHNTTGRPGFDGTTVGIEARFHPNMPAQDPLSLWTFDGTLPPKLLNVRYGQGVLMRHYNALPIDPSANYGFGLHTISTHEHNGHSPAESDGYTNAFFFPGQFYDYRWPIILAGHDTINTDASDPRAGAPDGKGGITKIPGDWRETMSTHWFHDHMLDFTAQNVYKGNASMMNYYSAVDRGNERIDDGVNLRLPSGTALDWGNRDYDVNLEIADKAWDENGQLWFNIFNLDGFLGDRILTNWVYNPFFEVRARRYRFRILNAAVARYFKFALVDQRGQPVPFHMVANDGNIMEHAIPMDGTRGTKVGQLPTQGIAERYDIIIDFSNFKDGDRLYLVNTLEHRGGRRPEREIPLKDVVTGRYKARIKDGRWQEGDPTVGRFLEFRVRQYEGTDWSMNPADYEPGKKKMIPLHRPTDSELAHAIHRTFEFGRSSGTDETPWTIKTDGGNGFAMDPRRVSAAPRLSGDPNSGTLEIWHIRNGAGGGWSHPIHIHFEEGIILSRDGAPPPAWEEWARKDVYRVGRMEDSGRDVEVALRFREFAGTYMEHCHNTQHEDHAMLMRWDLENPGQIKVMATPMPTWDGIGYVDSVALPTFRTGDGRGPQFEDGDGSADGGGSFDPDDDDDDDDTSGGSDIED